MKRVLVSIVCITLVLMLLGLAGAPDEATAQKDTLVVGMQDDVASLDPAKAYENLSTGIVNQLYEKLVTFREDDLTEPIPQVAESWELEDDGKTWTFSIRKSASFSSGNPINADAVIFSLQRALQLAGSPSSWLLTQFGITEDAITKIDEYTVQIVLDDQYAPGLFLSCLATPLASILDPQIVMEHEQDGDRGSAWLEEHSAGSGPFILDQATRGECYILKANEHYCGEKPRVQTILVKSVQESLEQMAMLERGEIDIAWNLQPDQVNILSTNVDIQIFESLTVRTAFLNMNLDHAPFKKPEVRRAIRFVIDYDGIITYVLQGAAVKSQTLLPKGLPGHDPALPYTLDVERAKQLLVEAGYPNGFEVEFSCLDFPPWIDVAMKIKVDLAKIGIDVTINPMDADRLDETEIRGRNFQMYMWEWWPDYFDPDGNAKITHCDSSGDDATVKLLAWEAKYVNPELSILIEQAAQELDSEKRKALYKRITEIVLDDGPLAFLYTPLQQYGIRREISDLIGNPPVVWFHFPTFQ